jgi:hypothetical protein
MSLLILHRQRVTLLVTKNHSHVTKCVLSIAHWVLNAHKVDADPRTERSSKLEQKFFALAKQIKYENLVTFASEHNRYFPTREYEETNSTQTCITKYKNDTFWEDLVSRLAERNLARQLGGYDRIPLLSLEELFEKLGQLEEYYGDEFARNGLENLQLRDQKWSRRAGKTVH